MTTLESRTATIQRPPSGCEVGEAQLAAAAFLARYNGRPWAPYRHDLHSFFQWAADVGLAVLPDSYHRSGVRSVVAL